jgi:O-acetylserine/cysteine efflux transporter
MVIGFDPLVLSQPDVLGLALLSALFQALGSIYMRGLRGISVLNFQAWSAVISLPFLILASALLEQGQLVSLQSAGGLHWASVAYSALAASLVGHGVFYYLVQRNPVTAIMPYMLLTPVFAVLFGILVWGDRPGWKLIVGGIMVLIGILLITLRARKKSHQPAPA